ncbi:hypothetical protein VNO77_03769 [Canavalia gladiata]|uniref:Uncharacterized protein n=1 Tax=Canavalia gladiata TaxID=3824 RepID=A0AAN9MVB9_CANGL
MCSEHEELELTRLVYFETQSFTYYDAPNSHFLHVNHCYHIPVSAQRELMRACDLWRLLHVVHNDVVISLHPLTLMVPILDAWNRVSALEVISNLSNNTRLWDWVIQPTSD